MSPRVLLLEEGWGATLYLARALDAAGFAVTVLTAGAGRARHRRGNVQWSAGPPIASPALLPFLDRVAPRFDHVMPLTEAAMFRLWEAAPAWSDRIFPGTDERQRRLLRCKHRLLEHLASCGVDVPRQRPLDLAHGLGYPLVVKGATGAAGARVRIVESEAALAQAIRRARDLGGEWVLQELVPGPTCLVGGLFHQGEPLRVYAGEKIEQYPARTGPAVRLRSDDGAALLDVAARLFRELRWTGLAAADFIRRRDGRHVLLEVNPRPWGSIAAAASAGVDLFTPFAELLAGRVPRADLAFAANDDCRIFPRYLMAPQYHGARGVALALHDLLGHQGREWRDPRFVLHRLRRFVALRQAERAF